MSKWDELTFEDKRSVVELLIEKILVFPAAFEAHHIFRRFGFQGVPELQELLVFNGPRGAVTGKHAVNRPDINAHGQIHQDSPPQEKVQNIKAEPDPQLCLGKFVGTVTPPHHLLYAPTEPVEKIIHTLVLLYLPACRCTPAVSTSSNGRSLRNCTAG